MQTFSLETGCTGTRINSGRFLVLNVCRARFPLGAQLLCPRQLFSTWVAATGLSSCFCGLPRGTASLARPQIDEYVIEIAHDVRIGAERWHDALLRRVDVLAPVHDNIGKVGIVHRLQGIAERGRITRSLAVGTMTDMAIGVIAAES